MWTNSFHQARVHFTNENSVDMLTYERGRVTLVFQRQQKRKHMTEVWFPLWHYTCNFKVLLFVCFILCFVIFITVVDVLIIYEPTKMENVTNNITLAFPIHPLLHFSHLFYVVYNKNNINSKNIYHFLYWLTKVLHITWRHITFSVNVLL